MQKFEALKLGYGKKHQLYSHEAEDAYMEAIEALRYASKAIRHSSLEQIFRTILRNKCVSQYRKSSKALLNTEMQEQSDTKRNVLDELIDKEEERQGLILFGQLSEECQQVFRLRVDEGLSFKEIAKHMRYKNGPQARKKKYNCWNNWKKLIRKMEKQNK